MDASRSRVVRVLALSAAAGLLATVMPVLMQGLPWEDAPVSPLLRTAIEKASIQTIGLLFLAGILVGALTKERPWLIGVGAFIPYIANAFLEMMVDPTSHNLLPFEFLVYFFMGLPVALGAWIAGGGSPAEKAQAGEKKA